MKKKLKPAPKKGNKAAIISAIVGFVVGFAICVPTVIDNLFGPGSVTGEIIRGCVFGVVGAMIGIGISLSVALVKTKLEKWITRALMGFALFQLLVFVFITYGFENYREMYSLGYNPKYVNLPVATKIGWLIYNSVHEFWYAIFPIAVVFVLIEIYGKKPEVKVLFYLLASVAVVLLELIMLTMIAPPTVFYS